MTEERRSPRPGRPPPPAPRGFAGRPVPPRRGYRSRYARQMDDGGGTAGGRLAGLLLTFAVAALVLTHGLWQFTAPEPAGRTLRALLPPLTDLDQTLTANRETLREIANGLPADGTAGVPSLPVDVRVTREEALAAEPDTLRALVLTRMSEALYAQGAGAFRAADAAAPDPSLLSSQWALRGALQWLTADRHAAFRLPRLIAAGGTLVLASLAVWLLEGPARLIGPGASVTGGAVIAAVVGLGARLFALLFFGGDDVVDDVVRLVVRNASTTVLVVAAVFAAFGLLMIAFGALARRADRIQPSLSPPQRRPVSRGRGE